MFLLSINDNYLIPYLFFNDSFILLSFLFNLFFLITKPETKTWYLLVLIEAAKFNILPAISSDVLLPFKLFVPRCNIIKSGDVFYKQPLTWWIMPFVVALGIDLTETADLILLFNRQPSICFTVESSAIKVFFFSFTLFCFSDVLFPDLRIFAFGKLLLVSLLFWGVISSWGQVFGITSAWMTVSCWWTLGVAVAWTWLVACFPVSWRFYNIRFCYIFVFKIAYFLV